MDTLPNKAKDLIQNFSSAFTAPSFQRFALLLLAAILTTGSRTVSNLLRTVEFFVSGHSSSYHRVFSKRRWSPWKLSRILIQLILERYSLDESIYIVGDDTVEEHPGRKVFGKGRHRDAVRSSHSYTAFRWGHKWVVISILVKLPFTHRPWALPVLVALYYAPATSKKMNRRHRTPSEIMQSLLAVLIRWFPERKFIFTGDGAFGVHHLASFAQTHHQQLSIVSRFPSDARLYEPPYPLKGAGRPRVKGKKLPTPAQAVKKSKPQRLKVKWYGGGERKVEVITGVGYWFDYTYKLTQVRWVFVHDLTGTHRDEYFFTTDINLTPRQIIEIYTGRWSIEVTFEELRAYVGLQTTRGRTQNTVTRMAPCLFGLFSVVVLFYEQLPMSFRQKSCLLWSGKIQTTFSDAITTVRRWLWQEWIFETLKSGKTIAKLPRPFQQTLLYNLAPAA